MRFSLTFTVPCLLVHHVFLSKVNFIYSIFTVRFSLPCIIYYLLGHDEFYDKINGNQWWEKIYEPHVYKGLLLMNHWKLWKFVQWVIEQIQCHLFDLYCAIFFDIHWSLVVSPWCVLEQSQCHLFDLYCTIFVDMHCLFMKNFMTKSMVINGGKKLTNLMCTKGSCWWTIESCGNSFNG